MIQIKRNDATNHTVYPDRTIDSLKSRIDSLIPNIFFVCNHQKQLLGTITKGDLSRKGDQQTALQICNRNALRCDAGLADHLIARLFTENIHCIPLINEHQQLTAFATIVPVIEQLNLNIGSGGTSMEGFINLDISSDWYANHHVNHSFIEYNILADRLPYESNTVDNIYCSHVIEHLRDENVAGLLDDCINALKSGAVMRIACPDAEFLLQISQFENDFWFWRRNWFLKNQPAKTLDTLDQYDFLTREIATQRAGQQEYKHLLKEINGDAAFKLLTDNLPVNPDSIGNHINYWTYEKIRSLAKKIGFSYCIRSKYQGCVSIAMKGKSFDQTRPEMSLYVDLVK